MASSVDFVEYACEQLRTVGEIRYRKMFGEYMIYCNDKPILMVCDNTVFAKPHDYLAELLKTAEMAPPYEGAKPHYLLDIENEELTKRVAALLEQNTAVPTKKHKK